MRHLATATATLLLACVMIGCAGSGPTRPKNGPPPRPALKTTLTRPELDRAINLARSHLINIQDQGGMFLYEYNFITRRIRMRDNAVRQAGTLWSLVLVHQENPTPKSRRGVIRGLDFFRDITRKRQDGAAYIAYPATHFGKTGTVALVALALVDFLRIEEDLDTRARYEAMLDGYVKFLLSQRIPKGRHKGLFMRSYRRDTGMGYDGPSPYYDGETLLALARVANHHDRKDLRPALLASAKAMYQRYVAEPMRFDPAPATTKSFFHWGALAYFEIWNGGWPDTQFLPRHIIDMGNWMIDNHHIIGSKGNSSYAYEGLATAWEAARLVGDRASMSKFKIVIDAELSRFMTWQVGNPRQNKYLRKHATKDRRSVGAVMSSEKNPWLRIDTTQHFAHALILTRRYLYSKDGRN